MNRLFAATLVLMVFAGCGSTGGPELVAVHGLVTLDGKPVPEAIVEFVPELGRPSVAVTDDQGRYGLEYTQSRKGALVGSHAVRISTAREVISVEGKVYQAAVRESIPKRYNTQSELVAEVATGNSEFNFELVSK